MPVRRIPAGEPASACCAAQGSRPRPPEVVRRESGRSRAEPSLSVPMDRDEGVAEVGRTAQDYEGDAGRWARRRSLGAAGARR